MSENQIKSLEFLQNIISRMSNNSSTIKNIAIAIVTAIIGYYGNIAEQINTASAFSNKPFIAIIMLLWFLDSYYLKQERIFRHIYTYVKDNEKDCLNLEPDRIEIKNVIKDNNKNNKISDTNIISCIISISEMPYYLSLIFCLLYFISRI